MNRFFSVFLISINVLFGYAQKVELLSSGSKSSFRGLSVVDDKVVWVSGSNGTVAKSLNGGDTWQLIKVSGFEKTDFRDIEAFNEKTAIIMGIDSPGVILKTTDGGSSWKIVYRNDTKGIFLDAMDFIDEKNGIVIGDPIDNRFFVAKTIDGGNSWTESNFNKRPFAASGEACFASSGTNIRMLNRHQLILVSGGLKSQIFINQKSYSLPVIQGKESTGANSIAVKNKKYFILAGGDFTQKDSSIKNLFITKNGGKSWYAPSISPHGYRSCVEYIAGATWITCGLNGVDISKDNGNTFSLISETGFHVCRKAKKGKAIFLAGGNGKIGKLVN